MHFKDLLHPYYLSNIIIMMVYPASRALRLINFWALDARDELGITRENSLFYTIIAFTVVKWFRRYSMSQFMEDIFFTIKLALITGYIMADIRIAAAYCAACLAVWLLFKQPSYNGPSLIKPIDSIEEFEDLLGIEIMDEDEDVVEEITTKYDSKKWKQKEKTKQKKQKKEVINNYRQLKNMVFCEFYVEWANTCQHTKEIWAEYSLKYSNPRLKFVSVDLQRIPDLAKAYRINTSSMSRQLPTIILFEDGEEVQRFPPIERKTGRIARVLKYDRKEVAKYFDLDKRYVATRDLQ